MRLQSFVLDANGNLTVRNKGLSTQQTLTWDHENRLASLTATGLSESYLYDDAGIRVNKISNGTTTYYPFPHYEVSGSTVTKYYFFNGQRIAMRQNGVLTYLHPDHLGSTVQVTLGSGAFVANQGYQGYGKYRLGGALPTDHRYTGQKLDIATGLMYYNARYYDRAIGAFISPDTLVPDPTNVWDYNRFGYARLNPLRFNDPTGHQPQCDIATPDCQQQWSAWDQYGPYATALSWADFLAAYQQYNAYAADPGVLLQDLLLDAGDVAGNQAAARQRLGAGEWYAQRVAGIGMLANLFAGSYTALEAAQGQYAAANNESAALTVGLILGIVFGGGEPPPYDRSAFGDWGPNVSQKVIARDGGRCVYCGSTEDLTVDHVVSLKQKWDEGAHAWTPAERNAWMNDSSNLVTACRTCNSQKRDMNPVDWLLGLFTGRFGR